MATQSHRISTAEPPSFVVGQDALGHWLAVETHGLGAGTFFTREAALHYARDETGRRPGAVAVLEAVGPASSSVAHAAAALPPTG